jgi:hypothetical protein
MRFAVNVFARCVIYGLVIVAFFIQSRVGVQFIAMNGPCISGSLTRTL